MKKENKTILARAISTGVYLAYKFLTKFSMSLFPFLAIYTLFFNKDILSYVLAIGISTYCLYFQEVITKWQVTVPANGDKGKMKEIIRKDANSAIVTFVCLVIGIFCVYISWVDFVMHVIKNM